MCAIVAAAPAKGPPKATKLKKAIARLGHRIPRFCAAGNRRSITGARPELAPLKAQRAQGRLDRLITLSPIYDVALGSVAVAATSVSGATGMDPGRARRAGRRGCASLPDPSPDGSLQPPRSGGPADSSGAGTEHADVRAARVVTSEANRAGRRGVFEVRLKL